MKSISFTQKSQYRTIQVEVNSTTSRVTMIALYLKYLHF